MSAEISDLAAHCIRCGFCLESCPTFVVTGKETESPRGRIYLIRSADAGVIPWDESVKEHIDTCVGCRACETACPSGVEYGKLLELGRERLEEKLPNRGRKLLLKGITHPGLLRLQLLLAKLSPGRRVPGFVSRWLTEETPQAEKPSAQVAVDWPDLEESTLPPLRGQVAFLRGCAMDVLFPNVQIATRRLLRRVGYEAVDVTGCCGALHAHNGHLHEALSMSDKVTSQVDPKWEALITNSAGCGSFLKEHSNLRVKDIAEFLVDQGLPHTLENGAGPKLKVTYHDACHLAHGQGIRSQPRELIKAIPGIEYIELPDSDMCCGSGGIYNVTQPKLARQLLERKWANIVSTGAEVVVTGNPGCHAWIEQRSREAGQTVRVMHTAEFLERAVSGC